MALYSEGMYREALIVGGELKNKYSIIEKPIPSIGFKGLNIVAISVKAMSDVNSGSYNSIVANYESINTLELFNHLDKIVEILERHLKEEESVC